MKKLCKKFFKSNVKAFTLVELIIVITILVILATIVFISFQGYTKNARDSNRTSTLANLQKGLDIYSVQVGTLPNPDGTITSGSLNGVELTRVGTIGDNISRLIKLNKTPTDPVGGNNYSYGISSDNKNYQIGVTLENLETYNGIIKTTYADNGNYKAKVVGNYKYPLKIGNKLYSLPSLLFTGTGGDLSQTGNIYFIIDKGLNIPYTPDKTQLNNTQSTTKVLQIITGTGGLTLTGVNLSGLTTSDIKNNTGSTSDIIQALGLQSNDVLGNVVFGTNYSSNTNSSVVIPTNSCSTQPTYTNAIFTIGTPTIPNQSWQNTSNTSPCYRTCGVGKILVGNDCVLENCSGTTPNGTSEVSNATSTAGGTWNYNITPGLCTYTCQSGYYRNGSSCLPNNYFSGAGSSGDPYRLSGISVNATTTIATSCDYYNRNSTTNNLGSVRGTGTCGNGSQGCLTNGIYLIDIDGIGGNSAFQIYCDMNTEGGGLSLVAVLTNNGVQSNEYIDVTNGTAIGDGNSLIIPTLSVPSNGKYLHMYNKSIIDGLRANSIGVQNNIKVEITGIYNYNHYYSKNCILKWGDIGNAPLPCHTPSYIGFNSTNYEDSTGRSYHNTILGNWGGPDSSRMMMLYTTPHFQNISGYCVMGNDSRVCSGLLKAYVWVK